MRNQIVTAHGRRPATRAELLSKDGKFNPTQRAIDVSVRRKIIVDALNTIAVPGVSIDDAIELLEIRYRKNALTPGVMDALRSAIKSGRSFIGRNTFYEWIKADKLGGRLALVPKHKGAVRAEGGWEAKALELYALPGKPSMASVHRDLCRLYAFDCTYEQVSGYLGALPTQYGKNSAARIGVHLHKQQQKPFVLRHTRNLKAGSIYMADGYRADVYLAHPLTGKTWRPEIMHVIDLKSRYLVGFAIMANESGYYVMLGWVKIFERWNHVPPILYVDNGSGYKNRFTELEDTSYYERAGVQYVIHSIPHNPKGKGHIERYHRIVRDDFLKSWQPQFYCGPDMAKEVLDKTARDIDTGKLAAPSLAQFVDAYSNWIEADYHQRLHPENKYATIAQEWAELDPIEVHATAFEMARPSEKRRVQRAAVQLHNRRYQHPDLYAWNGKTVLVEFDMLNHHAATIRAPNGQLICDAPMVQAIGVVSDSFLADMEQKALDAKVARKQKQLDEIKSRAGRVFDAEAVAVGARPALEGEAREIEAEEETLLLDLTLEGDEA